MLAWYFPRMNFLGFPVPGKMSLKTKSGYSQMAAINSITTTIRLPIFVR
jgi:hypothetical protein